MCSCVGEEENEHVVSDFVEKHPIVFYVTIAQGRKVASKCVVSVLRW